MAKMPLTGAHTTSGGSRLGSSILALSGRERNIGSAMGWVWSTAPQHKAVHQRYQDASEYLMVFSDPNDIVVHLPFPSNLQNTILVHIINFLD
jgi:hypothetical protein